MRIACVSDQHAHLGPNIPECDLLIVAGDQCPDRIGGMYAKTDRSNQRHWFQTEWLHWREKQPVPLCLVTWGNHDFCGHTAKLAPLFDWTRDDTKRTYSIVDDVFIYNGVKIWLTPWSNQFRDWAFMKEPEDLKAIYAKIPEGIDILVSHQPPKGYGGRIYDLANKGYEELGSQELLDAIDRVQPKIVICGHIHAGHGRYVHKHREERFNGGNPKEFVVGQTDIYNVSVVNEAYELVHPATVIEL